MRTPRDRRESTQVDFYPEEQECPVCQQALKERYHKQRWIIRLDQHMKVVSHFLECGNTTCTQPAVVYRPQQEDALALRGYTFGLDVVARIGELRYRHNLAITKIRDQLQTESQLSISLKEVALLCEVFLALVTTVAHQDEELIGQLRTLDGLILAIDGVQPEKSHETLYILRDVRSGRVLVAKTLLSSATLEIELLIEEVLGLGLPIVGVISDKQESICLAVQHKLPTVPHQICQFHYLKDVAQPVCEADRHVKKELEKEDPWNQRSRATSGELAQQRSPGRGGLLPGHSDGDARRWEVSPRATRSKAISAVAADCGVGGTGHGRTSICPAEKALTHASRIERVPTGI